jgi:hypothetical protein
MHLCGSTTCSGPFNHVATSKAPMAGPRSTRASSSASAAGARSRLSRGSVCVSLATR